MLKDENADRQLAYKSNLTEDDLVDDLEEMIKDEALLQSLVIYITNRDFRVWQRAYKLGREQNSPDN
jgi:DNA polymerase III delta prime subunit